MTKVADLLSLSMRAHKTAHAVRNQRGTGDNKALLREALSNREAAHKEDPTHTDPAWAAEEMAPTGYPGMHTRMMAFYEKALA